MAGSAESIGLRLLSTASHDFDRSARPGYHRPGEERDELHGLLSAQEPDHVAKRGID